MSFGRLLRRVNRLVRSTTEARFGAADLNFTQWTVLDVVWRAGALTQSDLAASMDMSSAALSRVVEGLVARDLLARGHRDTDRRTMTLSLTTAGRAKVAAILPIATQRWNDVFASLSLDETTHLLALLGKFADALESADSGLHLSLEDHEPYRKG